MKTEVPKKFWKLLLLGFVIVATHSNSSFAIEEGSLRITSRPSGATVYLDKTEIGKTETYIHLPVGSHKITFDLSGYKKIEKTVMISSGLTTTVHVDLQAVILSTTKPPEETEKPQKVQEPAKPLLQDVHRVQPPRRSLVEIIAGSIDPWVILLIVLSLIGIIILTLIIKVIPRLKKSIPQRRQIPSPKKKPILAPKEKPAPTHQRPVEAKAPSKPLRIPTPVRGISLKDLPVLGNYRVIEKLAAGGMATIYKAIHIRKGWEAVLKIPYEQFQNDRNFIERFRREAELGKKLHNENIIRIYESGTSKDGLTYIAMEYVHGIDLRQYLDKYGRMPIADALRMIVPVCRALDYAHVKGVIHRDIKPENIMLPYKKGRGRVVLMDFGVAHAAYLGTVGTRSTYLGTPFYMSPDQFSSQKVDGRSDIYSLGVVFFEMLTGRRPFDDTDPFKVLIQHREAHPPKPSSLNPEIPPEIETIVLKMLSKRPKDRYQSVEDLLVALQEYTVREGININ